MSNYDDFIAENKPTGKSKLDRFQKEILGLKGLGYSEADILRFLLEKEGVSVSRQTLNRFIRQNKKPQPALSEVIEPISPAPSSPDPQVKTKDGVIKPQIGKFDAREKINVDEWK